MSNAPYHYTLHTPNPPDPARAARPAKAGAERANRSFRSKVRVIKSQDRRPTGAE